MAKRWKDAAAPIHEQALRASIVEREERSAVVPFVRDYLVRYGYMRAGDADPTRLGDDTAPALAKFQAFTGLQVTGDLTLETLKMMRKPRCSVPDFDPEEVGGPGINEQDPFVFVGGTWPGPTVRWFLNSGTADTTGEPGALGRAFATWAAQIPLTIVQTTTLADADIVVDWATGDHGDGSAFDGVGTVLAHAFSPPDGRVHFDDSETWGQTEGGGTHDVETVALHEIGHALGLRHSGSSDAAMFFQINNLQRALHEFDIRGIKSRYPVVLHRPTSDVVTVPIWALKSTGGTGTVAVDLGRRKRILAWGQVTMMDSLADLDRDNAVAIDIFDLDGDRPAPFIFAGDHWGSSESPSNVYAGAFVGDAQRVTFRLSALHTADLDLFGTGTIIVLDDGGDIG